MATDNMAKYRQKSAANSKEHLAKHKAYGGFEKQRTAAQAAMHVEHNAAMDTIHATTLRRNAKDEAKIRATW